MFWKKNTPIVPLANKALLETIPSIVATLETLTEQNKIVWSEWAVRGFSFSTKIKNITLSVTIFKEYNKDCATFSKDVTIRICVSKDKGETYITRSFTSENYKKLYDMAENQEQLNEKLREQTRNAEFLNILNEILIKIINSK